MYKKAWRTYCFFDVLVAVAVVVAKTPYLRFANGEFSRVCASTKSKSDVFSRHFLVFAREYFKIT